MSINTVKVGVVDTGIGNIGSVVKMLRFVGADPILLSGSVESGCSHLILPGVGAYDRGVCGLRETGAGDLVRRHVANGNPLLGACLGMQLLLEGSDEGLEAGLGIIPGRCSRLMPGGKRKVPHMGWNWVDYANGPFKPKIEEERQKYYFTHSYRAAEVPPECVMGETTYGEMFPAGILRENVVGVQFHPEKSHRFGIKLFAKFLEWTP